jgi:hypothetical protein
MSAVGTAMLVSGRDRLCLSAVETACGDNTASNNLTATIAIIAIDITTNTTRITSTIAITTHHHTITSIVSITIATIITITSNITIVTTIVHRHHQNQGWDNMGITWE